MVNLKEKFGRRSAVIAFVAIVAAVVFAVCMATSTLAKADDSLGAEEGGSDTGVWTLAESYLTSTVAAPRNATFEASFKYTFAYDADASGAALKDTTYNSKVENMPIKVATPGVIEESASGFTTNVAKGNGTTGLIEGTAVSYPNSVDSTVWAYQVQKPMNEIFPFVLSTDDAAAVTSKLKDIFPETGKYYWDVTSVMTDPVSTDADYPRWTPSQAKYQLIIAIVQDGENWKIGGSIYYEPIDDFAYTPETFKKCPKAKAGVSFHPYWKPGTGSYSDKQCMLYEGFNFVHRYDEGSKINGTYDDLRIGKLVTGEMKGDAPLEKYPFSGLKLYSNTWNYMFFSGEADETTVPTVTGVIVDESNEAQGVVSFNVTKGTVTDSVMYAPATATPTSSDPIQLGDGWGIVFDGTTAYSTTTSTKLPVGTYYEYQEDYLGTNASKYTVTADTWTASNTDPVHTSSPTSGNPIKINFLSGTGASATVVNANAIVSEQDHSATGFVNKNKSIVTNEYTEDLTGFMIDAVPYIVMIGIPIVAFVIWMISRKRRYNN